MNEQQIDGLASKYFAGESRYPYTHAYDKIRAKIGGSRADIAKMGLSEINVKRIAFLKMVEDGNVEVMQTFDIDDLHLVIDCLREATAILNSSLFTKPMYQHDCDACTFLGISEDGNVKADLYHCPQSGLPTIIARRSSEGPDYISGVVFAKKDKHLQRAKFLAEEQGLLIKD